jgi:ribonuclease HII
MTAEYIIGVDEVGRGPLAGPVAVGIVLMDLAGYQLLLERGWFPAGRDSKKLSAKQRGRCFDLVKELKATGDLSYGVFFEDAAIIDQVGIAGAIRRAIKKGFASLSLDPDATEVLLDGGLSAPPLFTRQRSIIRGDEQELIIALASIAAKESRDSKMIALDQDYAGYGLAQHKGYGTAAHVKALRDRGPCPLHRRSFLRRILAGKKDG